MVPVNYRQKALIIYDSVSYFTPLLINKGLTTYSTFHEVTLLSRILRRIYIILNLPLSVWYGNWKGKLADCDVVILFETEFVNGLINYIHNKNPKIRQILWYWNPVISSVDPKKIPDSICEKWSFDPADCKKSGMKRNTTFYFDNIGLPANNIIFDIFFIGFDKGRRVMINKLENEFKRNNLNVFFYIVDQNRLNERKNNKFPFIPYQKALGYISRSKAILDIIQDGQKGASLRTMESIFFSKKLVTNDTEIFGCDYYHPDNVFVLNVDDMNKLPFFLNSPFHKLDKKVIEKYEVMNWFGRFFE